jgi:hypothetical protein
MFDPYTYFEETALPPSGIDRISIEISWPFTILARASTIPMVNFYGS